MNELITLDTQIDIEFEPSKIEIKNAEQLDQLVKNTSKHYSKLVFDPADIQGAKDSRKELNSIIEKLESKRLEIKKDYSSPLDEFEKVIKRHVALLEESKKVPKEFIDNYDEMQRKTRLGKVNEKIEEVAGVRGIDVSEIEIDNKWTNATAFTAKGELKKATTDKIVESASRIFEHKQRIENDKQIIEGYAKAFKLDVDSWLRWIDNGYTAAEITKEMDEVVANRNRQEKASKEVAIEEVPKNVDVETGEILSEPQYPSNESDEEELTIKLTGSYKQFEKLNKEILRIGLKAEVI